MDFLFSPNPDDSYTLARYIGSETIVAIPETYQEQPVTAIGDLAFCEHGLTSVTIPSSVKTIGNFAFNSCASLSEVTMSEVLSIGDFAFKGTVLTSLVLPDSLTTIGDFAFEGCTGLSTVVIPSSVKKIGNFAFAGSGLTSVVIPETVIVGDGAFHCDGLPNSGFNLGKREDKPL